MYFISSLKSSNKHTITMNFTVTITCLLYGIFPDVHGNLQARNGIIRRLHTGFATCSIRLFLSSIPTLILGLLIILNSRLTDTLIIRTAAKSRAKINYRFMFDWLKLALLRTLANEDTNSSSLQCPLPRELAVLAKSKTCTFGEPGL